MSSKRFKKKMKNFRQGMTAWRIWGTTLHNDGRCDWVHDKVKMDRDYGAGNYRIMFYGKQKIFFYCERICNVPKSNTYGPTPWFGGTRKFYNGRCVNPHHVKHSSGSMGDRYFPNKQQAQKHLDKLTDGLYYADIADMIDHHNEMDRFDDMFNDSDY